MILKENLSLGDKKLAVNVPPWKLPLIISMCAYETFNSKVETSVKSLNQLSSNHLYSGRIKTGKSSSKLQLHENSTVLSKILICFISE